MSTLRARACPRLGFTLWELILVAVILSVVVVLVAPRMAAVREQRVDGAARELAATLRRVRYEAVVGVRRVAVVLDLEGRVYRIEVESNPLERPGEYEPAPGSLGDVVRLPEGVRFESVTPQAPWPRAVLRPDGTAQPLTVVLANETGERRTVSVHERGEVTVR